VQRRDDDAELVVARALVRSEDLVFRPGRAIALNALANLRRREGRLAEAEEAAVEALGLYSDAPAWFSSSFSRAATPFDIPVGAASALSVLGFVAEARGAVDEAIERHQAAYRAVAAFPHPRTMAVGLEGLAAAAVLSGDLEQAARLLGCSDHLRTTFGAAATPAEQEDIRRSEQAAVAGLGADAFGEATRTGTATPPDDLVT
jgi:hypothetical protein